MDASTFDRLACALAAGGTRRRLLALLGVLPLASTMPFPQSELVEAGGRRRRRKRRHHPGGDKRHRKGMQKGQHKGQHQQAASPCGPESQTTTCAGLCGTVLNTCHEPVDCGPCACNSACPQCQTCNANTGLCELVADGTPCDDGDACTTNDRCQDGICAGTPVSCDPGQTCTNGTCQCASGTTLCNEACVNLQTDSANCGTCGTSCTALAHAPNSTCSAGICALTCDSGYANCDGNVATGCETPLGTDSNCNGCGNMCGQCFWLSTNPNLGWVPFPYDKGYCESQDECASGGACYQWVSATCDAQSRTCGTAPPPA